MSIRRLRSGFHGFLGLGPSAILKLVDLGGEFLNPLARVPFCVEHPRLGGGIALIHAGCPLRVEIFRLPHALGLFALPSRLFLLKERGLSLLGCS